MEKQLKEVRDWAQDKIDSHQEPPWAWYQYMKLIETCDAILAGNAVVIETENLQQLEQHSDNVIQLKAAKHLRDDAQPHQDEDAPQMPM